jgi:hypothetical protein
VDQGVELDKRSVDALVESVKPAHIPHQVEVIVRPAPPKPGGDEKPPSPSPDGDAGAAPESGDGEAPAPPTAAVPRSDPEGTTVIPIVNPSAPRGGSGTDRDGEELPRR